LKKALLKITSLLFIIVTFTNCNKKENNNTSEKFSIGIVSDCQYCDCEPRFVGGADRYYKKSPNRLRKAVTKLNTQNLEFTIHLGDFIDQNFKSFDTLTPIWKQLKSTSYHVLGNHDFSVADSLKNKIPSKMGLKNRYYSFDKHGWKFIVLDGNDLSLHGAITKERYNNAEVFLEKITKDSLIYAKFYNGGLGSKQLNWVKNELNIAQQQNLKVCFFNHYPVNPINKLNLWDRDAFLSLIKNYSNVKLYLNGHDHAGAYKKVNGVHYVTFKGMVDTKTQNSFAVVNFTKDSVFIKGYGREITRDLKLK